jgi:hypothetical protein
MLKAISEFSTKILTYGAFLITVVVITTGLNEPANAPKMLILVATSFALIPLCFIYFRKKPVNFQENKQIIFMLCLLIFFTLWLFVSNVLSSQPFEHGFYGTYGRNTGTLTYLALSVLLAASIVASLENKSSTVLKALYFAGISNIAYFTLTLFGIELFDWNNPNKLVLGTFGNSNFAGAFMGIFFVFLVGVLFSSNQSKFTKYFAMLLLPITFYEVLQTKATQGIAVCFIGFSIIVFYYLRSKVTTAVTSIYAISVGLIGLTSIAGILQYGPLEQYLYKLSVSLRAAYWAAGWQMGINHPIFGVGPDSYGFYYRQFRDQRVMDLVGPGVTTDAAHNVFMDIFAYGGFPLFLTYILIQILVIYKIITQFKKVKFFDPLFATLVACWIGYLVQSIVSINQIGIAIWGWILAGLILGYNTSNINKAEVSNENNSRKVSRSKVEPPQLIGALGLLSTVGFAALGFVIAIQPLISDAKYFSALRNRDIVAIDTAARKWPTNPVRLGDAATLFSNNGFKDQSIDIAKYAIDKYPNSYVSWYVYYTTPGVTSVEKEIALEKLKSFDPLNKNLR